MQIPAMYTTSYIDVSSRAQRIHSKRDYLRASRVDSLVALVDLLAEIRAVTVNSYETWRNWRGMGDEDAVHKNESRLGPDVARGIFRGVYISISSTMLGKLVREFPVLEIPLFLVQLRAASRRIPTVVDTLFEFFSAGKSECELIA